MNPLNWRSQFARETSCGPITMKRIGGWCDLCAYYRGSDGNAWSFQGRWSNLGPFPEFLERFRSGKHYRGELEDL